MSKPIWELFIDGSDTPVAWIDNKPNRRFAIYNPGGTSDKSDDLVLDKETGLIWPRNANPKVTALNWLDANTASREFKLANRIGWRLPTVEELSSLIDTRNSSPALPTGHPFLLVQVGEAAPAYWTCTNNENPSACAWFVNLTSGGAGLGSKSILGFVWPVRAGRGGVNWNW
jgi:hypothetical protein